MSKPKIKIGISYLLLLVCCLFYGQILLIINYTLALIFHELGHMWVAKSKGYNATNMKLDLLGMKLNIKQTIDKNDRFLIALAGPVVNFIFCILCFALWWLVPESYYFSYNFFQANWTVAIFNLMPAEPLDGGVMLNSLISFKSGKFASIISKILNITFIILFSILFILSFDSQPNLILLLFAIFFVVNLIKQKNQSNYDACYKTLFKRSAPITKVQLLKVNKGTTLFECFKYIKQSNYIVFYYPEKPPYYITEVELQNLLLKYDLNTKIEDAFN